MILRLLVVYVFLLIHFECNACHADNTRIFSHEALLSFAQTNVKSSRIFNHHIRRIRNIGSLDYQQLSDTTLKTTIKRKRSSRIIKSSERFLKSRNPCNEPSIKRLARTLRGIYCEPNWEGKTINTPNDTLQNLVYSANESSAARLHLPAAWDLTTGSSNIYIGVIDTGIDYNHPDLISNIWVNPSEISSNGIDDDSNGFVDDIYGIDPLNNDSDPTDDHGHGTYVSGILGAVGNNSRGLAGVAWSVKIISCKAFNSSGSGSGAAIISCLNYFVTLKNNFGFNIVATNNSYGGFPYSQSMLSAIEATKAANIVFVAGAGNQSSNNDTNPFYPANYAVDNIISVGAVDSAANKASFSNFGLSVDISAPGVGVLTTLPNNQYGYVQGTSMSAPHITGTVALLMAYHPTYHYSQAINSILNTGTIISGLSGKNSTSAIVNTEAALKYDAPLPTPTVTPIPSMTPTTTATSTPTIPPDNRSTTLKISSNATRTKVTVTCSLVSTINGIGRPLSNYKVFLNTKGIKTPKAKITNKNGLASFVLHPLRKLAFTARCNSKISDIDSDYIVRSRTIKLRTK